MTNTGPPARRRHPLLLAVVLTLIILLAVPATREIVVTVFWYVLGVVLGLIISVFLYGSSITTRRR